jgi:hypothetical protein
MNFPFTTEQFLGVFRKYNTGVWPMQIVLYILAALAIVFSFKKFKNSDKLNSIILSFFWLWMGIVYHLIYFTSINKGAYLFGGLFIIQAIILLIAGLKGHLNFEYKTNGYSIVGGIFILYALVIYALLGFLFGHGYFQSPTFGLPCPTTIFTFGLFLWTGKKVPKYVLIIPLIWSFIGFGAALKMTIYQDYGLLIAGILGTILIILRDKKEINKFVKGG